MKSLAREHPFDQMNETDVRETIVRPFLHLLGYQAGSKDNIRTEKKLTYDRAFLGRKDSKKDPVLQGRADYICEAIPEARWVVEVKAPSVALSLEDAQQAHTYAAHPEIAAVFYLLTNGIDWKLYSVFDPEHPIFEWNTSQFAEEEARIRNILGPKSIRKTGLFTVDRGQPLSDGVPSSVKIAGGSVVYNEHICSDPRVSAHNIRGLRNPISGGSVWRDQNGRIHARIELESAFSDYDAINKGAGLGSFVFETGDEFISRDVEHPTIFTNMVSAFLPPGFTTPKTAITPISITIPFGINIELYTSAVGCIVDEEMKGVVEVYYVYKIDRDAVPLHMRAQIPETFTMMGLGEFVVKFH